MRRLDSADRLFVASAAIATVALLWLGAGLTFFSDEWAFIEARALSDPATWFAPHNEHWSTLPILVYRALVETVGLSSYMPFLVILVGLHLAVATLVYVLVRRSSGRWPALAVSIVVLFLGSGFENLYWAFQIGFVGTTAIGLAAILAFDARPLTRGRAAAGVVLLVASLATTGIGVIFWIFVGFELLLDPERRRAAPLLAIPAVAYAAWYLLVGRVGIESREGPFGLGGLTDLLPVIVTGFAATIGSLVGVGAATGGPLALAIIGWALWMLRRGRFILSSRAVASAVAVAALYGLIGLTRSFVGSDVALYTRYTYISAALLIVGAAAQLGEPRIDSLSERRRWLLAGGVILALSLTFNVRLLIAGRALFEERAERTRALVTVALERPLPATTDPDRTLVLVPSPNALSRIVAAYGSPVSDRLVPWAVPTIPDEVLAEAREVLAAGAEIPLPDGADNQP